MSEKGEKEMDVYEIVPKITEEFWKKIGGHVRPPSMFLEKATKALEDFDDACKSLDIKMILVSGTALGMYRDKTFIKNDHDIDIGIYCNDDDFKKLYWKLIDEKNFVHTSWGHRLKSGERRGICFQKDRIMFDIFFLNKVLFEGFYQSRFFEKSDEVIFNGRKYNVPHPIEEYLEACYGEYGDWRTPIERYYYKRNLARKARKEAGK